MRRTRSSRSIQDIQCAPEPNGPPKPSLNAGSNRASTPPSCANAKPMRKCVTRTPKASAGVAAASAAAHTRWLKQSCALMASVRGSEPRKPYQPMAEALIHARGLASSRPSSRASACATCGREAWMRSWRAAVHNPPAMGSPAKCTITSKRSSAAMASSVSITRASSGSAARAGRRVSTVTACCRRAATSRRPMKPVPPVTSQRSPAGTSSRSDGLTSGSLRAPGATPAAHRRRG